MNRIVSIMEFTKQREKKKLLSLKLMTKYMNMFCQPIKPILNQALQEILKYLD